MKHFVFLIVLFFSIFGNRCYGQNPVDSSITEVSEILIPQCEKIKHQKNVYYEIYTSQDHFPAPSYWYKILFSKDCSFHFSLFPLYEEDTYDLFCFKLESDIDICNAISNKQLVSCNAQRIYKDYNDEVVKSKTESKFIDVSEIKAKAGDAIYIEILSTTGKDCGHILEFKTGLSFFVSKLINKKCPAPENYSADTTISTKPYQTLQTEDQAIELLGKTFCKIKKNELMVTSIKVDNHNATFNPGLDFMSYGRKKAPLLHNMASASNPLSNASTKSAAPVSATNVFVLTSIKKDSAITPAKPVINATASFSPAAVAVVAIKKDTVKKINAVKSTADLEETIPSATKQQNQFNSNALRHSRLVVDKTLFSTLLEEVESKIKVNEKQLKSSKRELKNEVIKEEKVQINASIKQLRQQNLELKIKMRDTKSKLRTIQRLIEQSEKKN